MSEPNAGSDLASVRTRAEPIDNGWLLNGQKIWTTNALHSDYMIALVRTSGTPEDRHKGLSQLIVDLRLPGLESRPISDLDGDEHFGEVFLDNVDIDTSVLNGEAGDRRIVVGGRSVEVRVCLGWARDLKNTKQ